MKEDSAGAAGNQKPPQNAERRPPTDCVRGISGQRLESLKPLKPGRFPWRPLFRSHAQCALAGWRVPLTVRERRDTRADASVSLLLRHRTGDAELVE